MRTKPSEVDLEMRNPSQRATIRLCYTPAPWMTPNSVGFLLIIAASHPSLSAGQQPFTVNITQRVYEMEEQENVTLTISFPTDPAAPPQPLHVDLMYIEPVLSVYTYNNAQGAREYVHHDYDGRLRCSQFASEGRVVFSITGLKMNDSSTYRCLIISGSKSNFTDFKLVVTAIQSQPEGEEPEQRIQSRDRIWICLPGGLWLVVIVVLIIRCSIFSTAKEIKQQQQQQQQKGLLPETRPEKLHIAQNSKQT